MAESNPRATAPRRAVVLGRLRVLYAPQARGIRPVHHQVGAGRIERHASPLGALHQVRSQGRGFAASELGRNGLGVGAVLGLSVRLYEHRHASPPAPLSSFLSSCPPFLLFDRAAGFLPPRPRIVAGRRAQMLSRLAALQRPPLRVPRPLQQSSTTAGLIGRVDYTLFITSSCQRALFR
jgi:hypothetical protein